MKKFSLIVVLLFVLLRGININATNLKYESQYVYMYDLDTKQVLMNIKANEKIYPASLTKMMTLLVAIEQSSNINEKVTITSKMLAGLKEANTSTAGFRVGDKVTIEDLLYGVNLPSGADSSNALAIHLSGSLNKFVALMNQKAKKIGMNNTHFVNVTGLHHSNHYSTLQDLSKLVSYAIKNELWYKVTTTKS